MSRAEDSAVVFDGVLPALLNKAQLGRFLGNVSIATIERLHSTGRLGPRPVKLGRLVRWRRDEIEAWIKAGLPWRTQWEERSGRNCK